MALRAIHSSGSYSSDVIVNGSNLGAPDAVYTTIAAAEAAASAADTLVIVEDAEFSEAIVWNVALEMAADDGVRHGGAYEGARCGYTGTGTQLWYNTADVTFTNLAMKFDNSTNDGSGHLVHANQATFSGCHIEVEGSGTKSRALVTNTGAVASRHLKVEVSSIVCYNNSSIAVYHQDTAGTVELLGVTILDAGTDASAFTGVLGNATQSAECVNVMVLQSQDAGGSFTGFSNAVAHSSYSAGYNGSSDTSAPGTTTYDNVTASAVLANDTAAAYDLHWKSRAVMESYTGADIRADIGPDFDFDGEALSGSEAFVGADYIADTSTPAQDTRTGLRLGMGLGL